MYVSKSEGFRTRKVFPAWLSKLANLDICCYSLATIKIMLSYNSVNDSHFLPKRKLSRISWELLIQLWIHHDWIMNHSWFNHDSMMIWPWFDLDSIISWSQFDHDLIVHEVPYRVLIKMEFISWVVLWECYHDCDLFVCCVLDKSLNEIGRLRMVKEVFEYPHSSIELNSSRKELGLLQGVS